MSERLKVAIPHDEYKTQRFIKTLVEKGFEPELVDGYLSPGIRVIIVYTSKPKRLARVLMSLEGTNNKKSKLN